MLCALVWLSFLNRNSLQAFAIPGAIFLSLLAGPLFGVMWGILLVTIVSPSSRPFQFNCCVDQSATAGSTICYFISWFLAKDIVARTFPQMIKTFSEKVGSLILLLSN
jgi:uncharacterized membrane protein YdjX (TVP38/TMEM64 family)